jgi:Transcription-repair coupling factor (superfamily II helicase)
LIHNDTFELFDERTENLKDYFEARNNSKDSFFLKPHNLFIDKDYLDQILTKFPVTKLSLFYNEGDIPINIKKINNISSIREKIDFDFIKKFFDINSSNKKTIICCNSEGSLEKVYKILKENIFISPLEIKNLSNLS